MCGLNIQKTLPVSKCTEGCFDKQSATEMLWLADAHSISGCCFIVWFAVTVLLLSETEPDGKYGKALREVKCVKSHSRAVCN